MESAVRAYWANWATSKSSVRVYVPETLLRRYDALRVGRTLDDALFGCPSWPVSLYEIAILSDSTFDAVEGSTTADPRVATNAVRIVRCVPLLEAFGPRTNAIVALLDELPQYSWLAPSSALDEAHVARLVEMHYTALGIAAAPHGFVREWSAALDIRSKITFEESAYRAARNRADEELEARATKSPFAHEAMRLAPCHRAYLRTWEAAWAHITRECPVSYRSQLDQIRRELIETCESYPGTAWTTFLRLDTGLEAETSAVTNPQLLHDVASATGHPLESYWRDAAKFAREALLEASGVTRRLLSHADVPDPCKPNLELYRLGLWPLGEHEGRFWIFRP